MRRYSIGILVLVGLIVAAAPLLAEELLIPEGFTTIQAAIDAAQTGDVISVNKGIYQGPGNRDLDFGGKAITLLGRQGPEKCIINCQGQSGQPHRGLIFQSGEGPDSVLEGFTITNGYADGPGSDGRGGGIWIRAASPTIRDCIFTANRALDPNTAGGAIYLDQADPVISDCIFNLNRGTGDGGAIYGRQSAAVLQDCHFFDNESLGAQAEGGALAWRLGGPLLDGCLIESNRAGSGGGCSGRQCGGIFLLDCLISDNESDGEGGGLYFESSDPNLVDCLVTDNIAAGDGGGIYQAAGNSYLSNCRLEDNQAAGAGGGFGGAGGRTTWDQVVLQANSADGDGGGLAAGLDAAGGQLEMDHCRVTGNTAGLDGGGLWWGPAVSAQGANGLWTGNTAGDLGGGLYCAGSTATLRQMTISGNRTGQYHGGGLFAGQASTLTLRSCILWENSAAGLGSELYLADPNAPSVLTGFHCCVRDQADCIYTEAACQVTLDADSISTDPNFVSPGYWYDSGTPAAGDDVWIFGGWELLAGSDCIDAGDPNGIESGETDLAGKDRWLDGAVDIGAFEAERQELTLERLTLQASLDRESPQDAFSLTGRFVAFPQTFTQADFVTLRVGSWSETLDRDQFRPTGKRDRYIYKGPAGGVTQLYLDFVGGQFRAAARKVDLTGTSAPTPVVLAFGSYYGSAAAADAGTDDLINAAQPLPVKFLAGYADSLAVYQAAAEASAADTVARLSLRGAISLAAPVDLCQTGVTMYWGTDSFALPAASFVAKNNGRYVGTQKALAADPASARVVIDQASCTFSILLQDTAIAWQDGPLLFGLAFGGYDQTAVATWEDD